jgi:hypothetical protein
MNLILKIIIFFLYLSNSFAEEFKSKFNFKFKLSDDYQVINDFTLYDVYKKSHKDPFKYGGKKVDLIECRMHDNPKFAEWSLYRENKSAFFENELTQQIIFQYNKKEYVITVACLEKCNLMKKDLFDLVETIRF